MKFIDLCAGIGFHLALHKIGWECVYASEINPIKEVFMKKILKRFLQNYFRRFI